MSKHDDIAESLKRLAEKRKREREESQQRLLAKIVVGSELADFELYADRVCRTEAAFAEPWENFGRVLVWYGYDFWLAERAESFRNADLSGHRWAGFAEKYEAAIGVAQLACRGWQFTTSEFIDEDGNVRNKHVLKRDNSHLVTLQRVVGEFAAVNQAYPGKTLVDEIRNLYCRDGGSLVSRDYQDELEHLDKPRWVTAGIPFTPILSERKRNAIFRDVVPGFTKAELSDQTVWNQREVDGGIRYQHVNRETQRHILCKIREVGDIWKMKYGEPWAIQKTSEATEAQQEEPRSTGRKGKRKKRSKWQKLIEVDAELQKKNPGITDGEVVADYNSRFGNKGGWEKATVTKLRNARNYRRRASKVKN